MDTIAQLRRARGLYIRCPSCESAFPVSKARLFDATKPLPADAARYLQEQRAEITQERRRLKVERSELRRRSFTSAVTSGIGQTLEMVTASLSGLPVSAQDCRVLLKPLDYIAFEGASSGKVASIRFIEVKTGRRRLSAVQSAIKAAVNNGAVSLRVADHVLGSKGAP